MTRAAHGASARREVVLWLIWAGVVAVVVAFAVWALHVLIDVEVPTRLSDRQPELLDAARRRRDASARRVASCSRGNAT